MGLDNMGSKSFEDMKQSPESPLEKFKAVVDRVDNLDFQDPGMMLRWLKELAHANKSLGTMSDEELEQILPLGERIRDAFENKGLGKGTKFRDQFPVADTGARFTGSEDRGARFDAVLDARKTIENVLESFAYHLDTYSPFLDEEYVSRLVDSWEKKHEK